MSRCYFNRKVMAVAIPILFFVSCVNQEYDLTKPITTDATFLENVSFPVGDVEKITIESLMLADSEGTGIICDENGDYHVEFTTGDFSTVIEVPDIVLNGMRFEDQDVTIPIPGSFIESSELLGDISLKYSELNGDEPLKFDMDIEFNSELPYQVIDVEKVELDAMLECHFNLNEGKVTVLEGFTLDFPEYVYLSPTNSASNYEVVDEHIIRFTENVELSSQNQLTIPFHFEKVVVPDDMIVHVEDGPDKLLANDYVHVTGDFIIKSADFATIPESLLITVTMGVSDLCVTEARLKLDYNIDVPDEEVVIDELPEILQGGDFVVDLYNPLLFVNAVNNSPFDFNIDAYVTAYSGFEENNIYIGQNNDPLLVYGNTVKDYYFSRRDMDVPDGCENIVIPQIGNLIKNIPDRLLIHDINVSSLTDMITVNAGESHTATVSYAMKAPLSFGEELYLSFTQDIENLNLQFDLDIPSAEVSMTLVNSIPIDFAVSAVCIDENGEEIEYTKVNLDRSISAGTQNSPSETPLTLTIENEQETLNVSSLRLTMVATSNEDSAFHGVCLNKNQGFEIKDITLKLPEGIGYEFNLDIM